MKHCIEYRPIGVEQLDNIVALYEQEGWRAYLGDNDKLARAFEGSLYMVGAFDEERLVGMIRLVGDGEHILIVQDLLVAPDYRNEGIGKTLLAQALEPYRTVRTKLVLTDLYDPNANAFYQALGLKPIAQYDMIGYLI